MKNKSLSDKIDKMAIEFEPSITVEDAKHHIQNAQEKLKDKLWIGTVGYQTFCRIINKIFKEEFGEFVILKQAEPKEK